MCGNSTELKTPLQTKVTSELNYLSPFPSLSREGKNCAAIQGELKDKFMKYTQILQYARQLRKNQTRAEKFFWMQVRNRRFKRLKFNRQFIIEHESRSYFIADFYCHQHKLIVEIDGGIHQQQVEYDQIREKILIEMGFTVIRFRNEEVLKKWEGVEKKLDEYLRTLPFPLSFKRGERIP